MHQRSNIHKRKMVNQTHINEALDTSTVMENDDQSPVVKRGPTIPSQGSDQEIKRLKEAMLRDDESQDNTRPLLSEGLILNEDSAS